MGSSGLAGLRIVSLETRRAGEMARLIERHGGVAIQAPSMREVPLEDQEAAFEFGAVLLRGHCDVLVLLTGVGSEMLVDALCSRYARAEILEALGHVAIVCRGPKPAAALKALGLRASLTVPEPNTWREMLQALDAWRPLDGLRVFVQEYGRSNPAFLEALATRKAQVQTIPIYAWQLPEDLDPLQRAVETMLAGGADAVTFTSGQQLEHLLQVAGARRNPLLDHMRRQMVVASIGPVTNEALEIHQLTPDLWPAHPKMGHLVRALSDGAASVLAAKRRGASPRTR